MSRLRVATRLAPVVVGIAALTVACGSSKAASSSDTASPAATTAAAPTSAAETSMPDMPSMSASAEASSAPAGQTAGGVTITIKDFQFGAPTGAITAGDTVTVINSDTVPHTYEAVNKAFESGTIAPHGGKATFVAPKAGSYQVKCDFHASMHGTLTVS